MALDDVALLAPNAYPRHREFNIGCAHLATHFADHLHGMDGGEIGKIALVASHEEIADQLVQELRVAVLTRSFDFDGYWSAARRERQERALAFIEEGCAILAAHYGWDVAAFAHATARVRADEFAFGRFARRPKASPNRKRSAGVWFEVDEVRAIVELRVLDAAGEIVDRHPVAETEPVEWWYVPHLGTVRWLDSDTIELRSKASRPKVFAVRPEDVDERRP